MNRIPHPIRIAAAAANPPANARLRVRVCCFFRACSMALETEELSETDSGYDGPLSFARTALRSFAMSSAFV